MKKRKIVFFLPLFALLLGGCDISSVYAEAKKLGHKVLDPVIDLVKPDKEDKKDDQGGGGGGQQQTATAVSISEVLGVPETIEQGATLSVTGLKAKVLYSDGKTKEESVTKVELNTSAVGQATGKAFVGSLFKEFNITVVAKDVPPVVETITPQQAIALMDQAGDGVVVAGLQKVKGICAINSQYDTSYKQYTTGFEGVSNFKLQFTDSKNILNGGSPDGMEIVVEGYLEKYQGKYQLSYLPAAASPTGEKFTPDLVSAEAVVHEGALESITVSEAHREFYKGSTFVEETVTAHYSDGSSATVKGTFTGYDMNTVGEQTVTVSYTEKEVTKTVTYKINVIERTGGHAGTLEDPLTTAEAVTIAKGLAETTDSKNPIASEGMYVKGVVTEFKETFSADFGNYSMVIGGDFTLWRIKNGPEFAKFNAGDIEVGDEVTAFVYIMNFKGTPESTSNSYVHSVQKAGDTKTLQSIEIVGSLTKTSYVEGQTYSSAGLSVKGHYDDGSEGTVAATITLNKTTAALGDTEIVASASFGEKTAEPKTFAVTVSEKVPVVGGAVYTFKNDKTQAQNMGEWTSEQFMTHVEVDGGEIITGMKNPTNAYIGGNGGSGDAAWNIWDSLKIGKSSAKGEITLLLDGTASFSKIKVSAIGARDDGTLTINEITQNVTKKATKDDLEPIELEYEITGGITELKLSSKDAASNNYGIVITRIEFISGEVPPVPVEIEYIEIDGSMTKTSYKVGEAFSSEGLSVKAVKVDGTESTVSGSFEFTPATAAIETTSVSVVAKYSDSFVSEPKTFNVTVEEEQTKNYGSENAPLTVSQALAIVTEECAEDKQLTAQEITVQGQITEIKNKFTYESGPCFEFNIGDGTNTIYIYRCHCTEEQVANVVVGATVKLVGYAKNFKGTLEFVDNGASQCHILSVEGGTPTPDKQLVSISIEGALSKTEYIEGDMYSAAGLSVKAHYDDDSEATVAGTITLDKTTATLGDTEIIASASFGEKNAEPKTFAITVSEATAKKGTLENPYTVEELLEAYKDLPVYDSSSDAGKDACFSNERVYVQGLITGDAPSTPQYTLEGGLVVYKPVAPETFERPCKGDVAIFEGYVEHYTTAYELASNKNHDGAPTCVSIVSRGVSTVELDNDSSENATVTFEKSVTNAADYSFTVAAQEGYQISCVKIFDTIRKDGAVLEGAEGVYSTKIYGNAKILVETLEAGQKTPTTLSTTTSSLVTANKWNVSSGNDMNGIYNSFNLDDNITVSTSGEANCGSVWGTNPNNDWRLYQNKGGDVTITAGEGYKIVSVKLTFTVSNTGALFDGTTQVTSGSDYAVDASSITFTVGNTNSKTNGQVRITGWSVVYIAL